MDRNRNIINFGPLKVNCQGDALIQGTVWNKLATGFNELSHLRG